MAKNFVTYKQSFIVLFLYIFNETTCTSEERTQGYYLKDCDCTKHHGRRQSTSLALSSCSDEASWLGPNQKVVSYSFFHDEESRHPFKHFVTGIEHNVEAVTKFYPGWIMRIYTNISRNPDNCKVACLDLVLWCDIKESTTPNLDQMPGQVWRFLPLGDETVDIFISRDLDSSIIEREKEAVTEWEHLSDRPFHAARDHPFYTTKNSKPMPVHSGRWGAKNYLLGHERAKNLRDKLLRTAHRNRHSMAVDDLSLRRVLYKPFSTEFLRHDSYLCETWNGSVPFPKRRSSRFEYVAMPTARRRFLKVKPCPIACRPTHGKNWTYC